MALDDNVKSLMYNMYVHANYWQSVTTTQLMHSSG